MKTILSNTTKGSIEGILQEVKKRLELKEDCIILTADRNVANMERVALDTLKNCGAEFRVNVMSFTRFCAKTLGDRVKRCLTPEGSVMLLADVIEKIDKRNFAYYSRVRADSLANEVYAALTALRNSGVSTDVLREKAGKMPLSLRNKAQDLALMYDGYLEALQDKREDSTTRLESLVEILKEDGGKNGNINFFVVGIDDFNHPQLKVLEALGNCAKSLTIGLVSGFKNKNSRVYPEKTVKKILALTKNRVAETTHLETLSKVQDSIVKNLFSYESLSSREIVEVGDTVTVKEGLTRQDEVMSVALDIVKKVQKGARYKDFEILIGSADYIPIIRNVFDRYGIVYFVDQKELLQKQTKAKYLLSALAVLAKNYRNEEVLDFVKNPLFVHSLESGDTITNEDKVFRFENYVLEYSINFGKFNQPFDCDRGERLEIAEEVRRALHKTLAVLGGCETRDMKDIVDSVRKFLDDVSEPWAKHVEKLAEMSKESQYYKKCAEQVDNKINAILDEIESVLTGSSTLEKFDTIIASMFKTLKIALVPTYLDSVFIGDMSSKFSGSGDLYVVGANSGSLPAETDGGTIITAKDEELFENADIAIYPTQKDRINKTLYRIIEIFSSCRGKLTISYSVSSGGGELSPSSIIDQFEGMFKKNGAPLKAELISFDNLRSSMITPEEVSVMFSSKPSVKHNILTYAESGRAVESDMDIYRTAYMFLGDEDKVVLDKIGTVPNQVENAQKIKKTSISRLEQYFKCPYGYYLKYSLGLQKRKEGEMESFDAGTILHGIFEAFFIELQRGNVTRENVEHIVISAFEETLNKEENKRILRLYTDKPDTRRIIDRMKKEGVRTCKDFYEISLRSKFKPKYLEAEFISKDEANRKYGDEARDKVLFEPITLDIDGRKVEIRGKIDRVDSNGDKFIIIDYKTFKGAGLSASELYHGEKIQLYIYAKAMRDNTGQGIAGVFYLPIYAGFNKEDEKRYSYEGQVTDDESVRAEIYGELPEGITSTFTQETVLPQPKNAPSIANTYLSDAGFDARCKYAVDVAVEGVKEIESGYIAPRPICDCTNCDFNKICRYREMDERDKYSVDPSIFVEYDKPKTDLSVKGDVEEGGQI